MQTLFKISISVKKSNSAMFIKYPMFKLLCFNEKCIPKSLGLFDDYRTELMSFHRQQGTKTHLHRAKQEIRKELGRACPVGWVASCKGNIIEAYLA